MAPTKANMSSRAPHDEEVLGEGRHADLVEAAQAIAAPPSGGPSRRHDGEGTGRRAEHEASCRRRGRSRCSAARTVPSTGQADDEVSAVDVAGPRPGRVDELVLDAVGHVGGEGRQTVRAARHGQRLYFDAPDAAAPASQEVPRPHEDDEREDGTDDQPDEEERQHADELAPVRAR